MTSGAAGAAPLQRTEQGSVGLHYVLAAGPVSPPGTRRCTASIGWGRWSLFLNSLAILFYLLNHSLRFFTDFASMSAGSNGDSGEG